MVAVANNLQTAIRDSNARMDRAVHYLASLSQTLWSGVEKHGRELVSLRKEVMGIAQEARTHSGALVTTLQQCENTLVHHLQQYETSLTAAHATAQKEAAGIVELLHQQHEANNRLSFYLPRGRCVCVT